MFCCRVTPKQGAPLNVNSRSLNIAVAYYCVNILIGVWKSRNVPGRAAAFLKVNEAVPVHVMLGVTNGRLRVTTKFQKECSQETN